VLESSLGWYWAADVLKDCGAVVHLAHPLGNNWGHRRVKNDERDATDLADLLRLGRLAESWIAPPELREQRELVRYRHKLVRLSTNLKTQVHAVLAKEGVAVPMTDLFGAAGRQLLKDVELARAYRMRVDSLLDLLQVVQEEIWWLDIEIPSTLADDPSYAALRTIPGIGPTLAAIFMAEIGDISRFKSPAQLCCWAGLTPTHRESDRKVRRGHITKQGSRLVRWAAIEAATRQGGSTPVSVHRQRVSERRGNKIGRVAGARKLLTLVFYALRDGEVRCLAKAG